MKRVVWTKPALDDLERIEDAIAETRPLAAHRLAVRLITKTETLLADTPAAGRQGRVEGTRELVAAGTPYILVYRIGEAVEILAVIHGAREWPTAFPPA